MSILTVQQYLLAKLDGLEMPSPVPAAQAYITPPDPRVQARVPAIYVWPSDGRENRSAELGGTIPRNTGVGTASGTKGILHQFDIYVTWFSANQGRQADPLFPGIVDTIMAALRFSLPNPYQATDPNTGQVSTIYNVGEDMQYRIGVEATADERWLRYDSLIGCPIWEILNA